MLVKRKSKETLIEQSRNTGKVIFPKALIGKKTMIIVHGLCFTLLMIGSAAGLSNPATAGGVEHDYDEDRFDNFEESDLNPENENYVGDDRIRELRFHATTKTTIMEMEITTTMIMGMETATVMMIQI